MKDLVICRSHLAGRIRNVITLHYEAQENRPARRIHDDKGLRSERCSVRGSRLHAIAQQLGCTPSANRSEAEVVVRALIGDRTRGWRSRTQQARVRVREDPCGRRLRDRRHLARGDHGVLHPLRPLPARGPFMRAGPRRKNRGSQPGSLDVRAAHVSRRELRLLQGLPRENSRICRGLRLTHESANWESRD